jgi:hypothetical protein
MSISSIVYFVHALARVPMEESLAAEHRGEVFGDAFKHLLNGGGISKECAWS